MAIPLLLDITESCDSNYTSWATARRETQNWSQVLRHFYEGSAAPCSIQPSDKVGSFYSTRAHKQLCAETWMGKFLDGTSED